VARILPDVIEADRYPLSPTASASEKLCEIVIIDADAGFGFLE
jgi:hypothetical protein